MGKIIGVGWQKTGTSSLGQAFRNLGLETAGWHPVSSAIYKSGHHDALLAAAEHFEAFEDVPWAMLYEGLVARHPGSKLVLTLRKDLDSWFQSLVKHRARIEPKSFSSIEVLYGVPDIENHRDIAIARHESHIANVRAFAASNNVPLLEVCWEEGDGWAELCDFLGCKVPDRPFPHANQAPAKQALLKKRLKQLMAR